MRLIDADLLKENIVKWLKPLKPDESETIKLTCVLKSVVEEINEQPTAYDVEAVVEQLDTYITKLVGRNAALYQTVMQIVKGGGIK